MYADTRGRKAALSFVILLMFVSTAMLAFAPTYQQAGMWAPVIVVISRILQGIAAGGEFGSATALLVELAPENRKGFYGSWQMFAQAIGSFMATLSSAMLTSWFSSESLTSWAWRLPFIVDLIGYWIRRNIDESDEFKETSKQPSIPFRKLLTDYPMGMFISIALGGATNVVVYVLVGYLPIYAVQTLHLPINTPFVVLSVTMPVRMLFVPIFGHLSDKVGRKRVMGTALALFIPLVYPAFVWLSHAPGTTSLLVMELGFSVLMVSHAPGTTSLLVMELGFSVLMAAVLGPFAATAADLFPTGVRSTGMSLTYNLTAALLGGFSPFILTWLVAKTGDLMMPAHYMVLFLSLGALSLLCYKQGHSEAPDEAPCLARGS